MMRDAVGAEPGPFDDGCRERIRANHERVRAQVTAACLRAARAPEEVRIIGVTKYVGIEQARVLFAAGCTDLAESRPQRLWEKAAALPSARWHLVGRLQRNKVRRTLSVGALVHSLDSRRLLGSIDEEAASAHLRCEALLEVNLDGDPVRGGVAPEDAAALVEAAAGSRVTIRGLMGMASAPTPGTPADAARRQFAALRLLRDSLAADHPQIVELSMGMSGDYVDAILEGATMVRIGSALWEGVTPGTAGA